MGQVILPRSLRAKGMEGGGGQRDLFVIGFCNDIERGARFCR